jgi:hypothetical protein
MRPRSAFPLLAAGMAVAAMGALPFLPGVGAAPGNPARGPAVLPLATSSGGLAGSGRGGAAPWFLEVERTRIQHHLERVEQGLRSSEPFGLSPAQRQARARQLDRLREYRLAGEFPRNVEAPGLRTPVFQDDRGVLCAVGYLLAIDGRRDLVERVARTRNLARIPELADEPGLLEWLHENGLSVDEAAWIQPSYDGWWPGPEPESQARGSSSRYRTTSTAAAVVGGLATGWNLAGVQRGDVPSLGVTLGIAAGASSLALGASRLDEDSRSLRRLAMVNLATGILSMGTAIHAGRRIRVEMEPWIPPMEAPTPDGPAGDGTVRAMGVQGAIRF